MLTWGNSKRFCLDGLWEVKLRGMTELARAQGLGLSLDFVPRNWEDLDGCKEA